MKNLTTLGLVLALLAIAGVLTAQTYRHQYPAGAVFFTDDEDLQEKLDAGDLGGAPADAQYLVGAANGVLTSEVVIATLPQLNSHLGASVADGPHTTDASLLTSGILPPARVGPDHIDDLGEISSSLRSGLDATLITGTATSGECAEFNADGDIVGAGAACGTGGGGGAPTDAEYLVGSADATLSAEVVIATLAQLNTHLGSNIQDGPAPTSRTGTWVHPTTAGDGFAIDSTGASAPWRVSSSGSSTATQFITIRHATLGDFRELWNSLEGGSFRFRENVSDSEINANQDCTLTDDGWTGATCPYGQPQWYAIIGRTGAALGLIEQNAEVFDPLDLNFNNKTSAGSSDHGITVEEFLVCEGGDNDGTPCTSGGDCTGAGTCTKDDGIFRFSRPGTWRWDISFSGWWADPTLGRYNTCAGGTNSGMSCRLDADCPSSTCSSDSGGTVACLEYLGYIEPGSSGTGSIAAQSTVVLAPKGQYNASAALNVHTAESPSVGSGILTVDSAGVDFYFYSDQCNFGGGSTTEEFDHTVIARTLRIIWTLVADAS